MSQDSWYVSIPQFNELSLWSVVILHTYAQSVCKFLTYQQSVRGWKFAVLGKEHVNSILLNKANFSNISLFFSRTSI